MVSQCGLGRTLTDRRDIIPIVEVETPVLCVDPEQRTEITDPVSFFEGNPLISGHQKLGSVGIFHRSEQ